MLDPYRILGLPPGASQAEIKRAYRRLVKAYHPDSAGPGEIGRFLTIQRAYDQLKSPAARRSPRTGRPEPTPPSSPWAADPERARATRERAGARRPAPGMGNAEAHRPGGEPGAAAQDDGAGTRRTHRSPGSRSRRTADGASRGQGRDEARDRPASPDAAPGGRGEGSTNGAHDEPRGRGRPGRRRPTRKATFGSTTYDEARDRIDPRWSGASWYGPSSGEYWTVNPREYADPRKHGPEYLARARRPLPRRGEGDAPGPEVDANEDADVQFEVPEPRFGGTGDDAAAPPAAGDHPDATTGEAARAWPPARERRASGGPAVGSIEWPVHAETPTAWAAPPAPPGAAVGGWLGWLPADARDPFRRFLLALIAWPPLGLAAATISGTVTGCIDASVTCTDAGELLPWIAQAAILGLLFAAPAVAAVLAAGSVVAFVAAVPATAILVAFGASYDREHGPIVLAVLLSLAWVVGIVIAVSRRRRGRGGRASLS